MAKRRKIPLTTKLAAALFKASWPAIPYEHAKGMTAAHFNSLFQFDHNILHETEPCDEFWNLTPRLIAEHREKSKADAGIVAKGKRLRSKAAAHEAKMRAVTVMLPELAGVIATVSRGRKRTIPSRPFPPKGSRTLRRRR